MPLRNKDGFGKIIYNNELSERIGYISIHFLNEGPSGGFELKDFTANFCLEKGTPVHTI